VRPAREIATLRIESLAAGGAGVGKLERGLVVFTPQTAPSEVVEVEVDLGPTPAQGRLLRVLTPASERVVPPCRYVTSCGGCDWMHLSPSGQRAGHAAILRSAIAHALPSAKLPEIRVHPAPAELGYRTRARLFARAERGRVRVGYRGAGTHAITAVDACLVLAPALSPVIGQLAEVLFGASGEGDALIGCGADGLPVVEIAWRGELTASTWAALDAHVQRGAWAGARVVLEGVRDPASFGDPRPVLHGVDGAPLLIAPGGFAQPSSVGAALLAHRVAELALLTEGTEGSAPIWKESRPRHIVELFAGSGTLSVLLARDAASFIAVEIDPGAVACARQNLAARGLSAKVSAADADAFAIPPRTEVVVLDPPRAGAPFAVTAIGASSARVVVYVACDPPSLARDLGALVRGGFELTHIEAFELFPQTSHVETVVRAVRAAGRRAKGSRG
jgi:23S rRNA (uracil1939-C5)-methyltransferase